MPTTLHRVSSTRTSCSTLNLTAVSGTSGADPIQSRRGGKDYLVLPGIDGGISIQQSLEIQDLSGDIQLTGSTPEILALALIEDFQNRAARVHLASLDSAGLASSVELAFSGLIDDIRIQEGPDNPSLEIIIRSIFADLEVATDIRYAAADQSAIDEHDTFFDFLEAAQGSRSAVRQQPTLATALVIDLLP